MAMRVSEAARNALLTSIATSAASGNLRIYTGSVPADPDTAPSGTLLVDIVLPGTPFNAASGGSMSKNGTWSDSSANASGTAGCFRMIAANSPFYHVDGSVTATGGGGDLQLDTTTIVATGIVTVTSFTLTCT